jgi:hypothetical protein
MTLDELKARAKQDLDNAFEKGKAQGDGGGGYYDAFWDNYQQNGNRTDYGMAFYGIGWNDANFKPKYDIIHKVVSNSMFRNSEITCLKGKLEQLGLTLDVSQCSSFLQMFQGSKIKDIPILDGTNCTSLSYTFGSSAQVETIEKLILSNKLTNVGNAFSNATKLTHVIFEGELAITGLDLHWSILLDAESYHSLMSILSPTTTGMSVTLPPYATVKATYDAVYGEGAWDAIIKEHSNVSIVYS